MVIIWLIIIIFHFICERCLPLCIGFLLLKFLLKEALTMFFFAKQQLYFGRNSLTPLLNLKNI